MNFSSEIAKTLIQYILSTLKQDWNTLLVPKRTLPTLIVFF